MLRISAITLAIVMPLAHGQALTQADSTVLQAQIGRDQNGFSSCGVRAIVAAPPGKTTEMFDFSIVLYKGKYGGLIKAGKYLVTTKDIQKNIVPEAVKPSATKFWIAADTDSKPLIAQHIAPAETPGFILGVSELELTLKSIMAIAQGENMQFALRYPSEKYDHVYGFTGSLSASEKKSLSTCLSDLMDALIDGEEASPK